jgi:hypothetical protein
MGDGCGTEAGRWREYVPSDAEIDGPASIAVASRGT